MKERECSKEAILKDLLNFLEYFIYISKIHKIVSKQKSATEANDRFS